MHKPWSDVIPCTYEMKHTLKELIRVKAFLLAGTTVSIVEEKVSRPGGFDLPLAGGFCVCVLFNVPFPSSCCHLPDSLSLSRTDKMDGDPQWLGSSAQLRAGSCCLDPLLACGTNSC